MTRARTNGIPGRHASSDGGAPSGRSAAIRWKVGSAAGRRAFGVESDSIALELRLTESSDGLWMGDVRVVGDGADTKSLGERSLDVHWQPDRELGLLHIDADGFVRATIDTSNGTPRLLYARSTLLGELGLGGGRYEPADTELGNAG